MRDDGLAFGPRSFQLRNDSSAAVLLDCTAGNFRDPRGHGSPATAALHCLDYHSITYRRQQELQVQNTLPRDMSLDQLREEAMAGERLDVGDA